MRLPPLSPGAHREWTSQTQEVVSTKRKNSDQDSSLLPLQSCRIFVSPCVPSVTSVWRVPTLLSLVSQDLTFRPKSPRMKMDLEWLNPITLSLACFRRSSSPQWGPFLFSLSSVSLTGPRIVNLTGPFSEDLIPAGIPMDLPDPPSKGPVTSLRKDTTTQDSSRISVRPSSFTSFHFLSSPCSREAGPGQTGRPTTALPSVSTIRLELETEDQVSRKVSWVCRHARGDRTWDSRSRRGHGCRPGPNPSE